MTATAKVTGTLERALKLFSGWEGAPLSLTAEAQHPVVERGLPVVLLGPSRRVIQELKSKGYAHRQRFLLLPSINNPRWLLPCGNSRTMLAGSQIYMPHRPVARFMKRVLITLLKGGWAGRGCRKIVVASRQPLPFEDLVRNVTGETQPIFAMSLGTKPAVSKLTVQVMTGEGQIVGYVKAPLGETAADRVRHEAAILERLWNFPSLRPHVPRLLHSGTWNGTYLLFQSPLDGQPSPVNFSSVHDRFLQALHGIHAISKPGSRLVQDVASKWGKAGSRLPAQWQELGREALRQSTRSLNGDAMLCGPAHGDFAPWNMRIQHNGLLLFDWESADWEAPQAWDKFHFQVQTVSSLNRNNFRSLFVGAEGRQRISYILYLLNSVCQFLEEENQSAIEYRRKLLTVLLLPPN